MATISAADLIPAARSLGPSLAERSERIEATRTLPEDVVADLRASGLFRLLTPKTLGGPEADVATAANVIAEVARYDGAAAWCVMIAGTTTLQAGFLPEDGDDPPSGLAVVQQTCRCSVSAVPKPINASKASL